jgi:hypothetical protein
VIDEAAPEVVADDLVNRLVPVLGDDLVSLVAHGSWVHGDFSAGRSDLDLVIMLDREPNAALLEVVGPVLDAVTDAYPDWRNRLEIGFATQAAILAVIAGEENSHLVGRISPGEPLHLVGADRHRLLDWDAAHRGRALAGAPTTAAVPPIPPALVRSVVREHLASWPAWLTESDATGYRAYAVLTVSRAAAYLATGQPHSKRAGAIWAGARFPGWRGVTDWATRWWYAAGNDTDAAPDGVAIFVDRIAQRARPGLDTDQG